MDPVDIYLPVIFDGAGFGPGTVTGHVIDAVEGTFLDGVEICYFNNDACEYTDENGEYTFTNMPSGYRIFTAEGENFAVTMLRKLPQPARTTWRMSGNTGLWSPGTKIQKTWMPICGPRI